MRAQDRNTCTEKQEATSGDVSAIKTDTAIFSNVLVFTLGSAF